MNYPSSELVIDPLLIREYDVSGACYASYPTSDRFAEAFDEVAYRQALGGRSVGWFAQPLSVYVGVPFFGDRRICRSRDKQVILDSGEADRYLDDLTAEMRLLDGALQGERRLAQMHWGGGTTIFLGREHMASLVQLIDRHFGRDSHCESSIELDPREAPPGAIDFLAGLGFNRLSLCVQDFDAAVQDAIHRAQPAECTQRVTEEARKAGFHSVSVDLVYGLPRQTLDGFSTTLDRVIALGPDRIALHGYAPLPQKYKPPRRADESLLPGAESRLQILTLAIGQLVRAGYLYIGMDYFARPSDDLAVAQRQGRLNRNILGYSTLRGCDLIGLGVSAIGCVGATYSQNHGDLRDYRAALGAQRLPVARGLELTRDDLVRSAVIQALSCQFCLSMESVEAAYLVDFREYFAPELEELRTLEDDGLVVLRPDAIEVTAKGRLLVRVVCMVFDRYLREGQSAGAHSPGDAGSCLPRPSNGAGHDAGTRRTKGRKQIEPGG